MHQKKMFERHYENKKRKLKYLCHGFTYKHFMKVFVNSLANKYR